MKYLVIALLLLVTGCADNNAQTNKYNGPSFQDNINAGIQACIKQNGVLIISSWDGRLLDCKFKEGGAR